MKSKELAILCVIVIICVAAICCAFFISNPPQQATEIKIISNSSLYNGEVITVQLTSTNGTAINNQSVNLTIIDANGSRNVQNLTTDKEGKASFVIDEMTAGNYTLECLFDGSDEYKQSNCTSTLEIKKVVESTNDDYSGYSNDDYSSPESRGYKWSSQCGAYVKSPSSDVYEKYGYPPYGGYMETSEGEIIWIG